MSHELTRKRLSDDQAEGLRRARIKADLSQQEAAALVNYSETSLRDLEKGRKVTVPRLAVRALLTVYWFQADDTDPLETIYRDHDLWDDFNHSNILQ